MVAQGRDPDQLEIHVGGGAIRLADGSVDFEAAADSARRSIDAGATTVIYLVKDFCRNADDVDGFLDWLISLKNQ